MFRVYHYLSSFTAIFLLWAQHIFDVYETHFPFVSAAYLWCLWNTPLPYLHHLITITVNHQATIFAGNHHEITTTKLAISCLYWVAIPFAIVTAITYPRLTNLCKCCTHHLPLFSHLVYPLFAIIYPYLYLEDPRTKGYSQAYRDGESSS